MILLARKGRENELSVGLTPSLRLIFRKKHMLNWKSEKSTSLLIIEFLTYFGNEKLEDENWIKRRKKCT